MESPLWDNKQTQITNETAKDIITNLRLSLIEKANQIIPNAQPATLLFWVIHYINSNHYSFIIQYISPDNIHHFINNIQTKFIHYITQKHINKDYPLFCKPIKYYHCLTKVNSLYNYYPLFSKTNNKKNINIYRLNNLN